MFSYRCSSCGKEHVIPEQPAQDLQTRCLRCQNAIHVPGRGLAPGAREAAARSAASQSAIRKAHKGDAPAAAGKAADSDGMVLAGSSADSDDDYGAGPFLDALDADDDWEDSDERIALSSGPIPKKAGKGRKAAGKRGAKKHKRPAGAAEEDDDDISLAPADLDDDDESLDPADEESNSRFRDPKEEDADASAAAAPAANLPLWKRWQFLAGVGAVVLIAATVGGFLLLRGKSTTKKGPVARSTTPRQVASASTKTTKTKTPDKPPEETKPAPKPKPLAEQTPDFRLSAVRLATELAADAEAADRKYKGHVIDVSGLYDRVENKPSGPPAKAGAPPSISPELLFLSNPVHCQLAADPRMTPVGRNLAPGQPATVRGIYQGKAFLSGCILVPTAPPADAEYLLKDIEVKGVVLGVNPSSDQNEYPWISLETPTDSLLDLRCYFQLKDEAEVRKIKPGTHVVVAGGCRGRKEDTTAYDQRRMVRLDNCHLVYTSAPAPTTPRLEVGQLLRSYEEDLRLALVPLPDAGDKVEASLSVAQLSQVLTADPRAVEKYRYKVISVTGLLSQKVQPSTLVLTSGQTDQPLKVRCLFSRDAFARLDDETPYRVRGMVTGLDRGQLRLDNCTPYDPEHGTVPRLTADYLPHTPGKALTYDVAVYTYMGKKRESVAMRQIHFQRDNGLTEVVLTHLGKLPKTARSILGKGGDTDWVLQKGTKEGRQGAGSYHQRLSGGFVEIGHPTKGKEQGKVEMVWEPALKLRAKAGDTWSWDGPDGQHSYKLEAFTDYQGEPAVVIRETVNTALQPAQNIRHVYVRDVGEVERQQGVEITSTEVKVVGEKKLLPTSSLRRPGKKPVQPGGPRGPALPNKDAGKTGEGPRSK